jgi:hypothetical protein
MQMFLLILKQVLHIIIPGFKWLRDRYFIYNSFKDPGNSWDYVTSNGRMIRVSNELERMEKEAVMVSFLTPYRNLPEGPMKSNRKYRLRYTRSGPGPPNRKPDRSSLDRDVT